MIVLGTKIDIDKERECDAKMMNKWVEAERGLFIALCLNLIQIKTEKGPLKGRKEGEERGERGEGEKERRRRRGYLYIYDT